jgi:hypothetical protein
MNSTSSRSAAARIFCAGAVVVLLAALFACWMLGGAIVNPRNLSWMTGDFVQCQFAWEAYRGDPQPASSLATSYASWPLPLQIAMFDIVPLAAFPLKLLSPWLPATFQYFGPLFVVNAALQGLFAFLFFKEAAAKAEPCWERDAGVTIAALFIAAAPVLYARFYLQHAPLTAQWLVIAALWLYARSARVSVARTIWAYGLLLFVAGGINPYLLVMTTGVYCGALIKLALERRLFRLAAAAAALPVASALGALILFGFLDLGGDGVVPGEGYGYYSSNFNTLFNPMTHILGSSILPPLPTAAIYQYEGYGYLGAGAMIVVLAGLWIGRSRQALHEPFALPLLVVALGAFMLAASTTLTFGAAAILLPTPAFALKVLEIFRSSGRFVWVTYYILLALGAALLLRQAPPRVALAVLTLGAAMQIVDLAAPYATMRAKFAAFQPRRFTDAIYADLGHAHSALVVIPPWQCAKEDDYERPLFEPISLLAIDNHLRTNSFYAGRLQRDQERYHCVEFPRAFASAPSDLNAAYLFTPRAFAARGGQVSATHFCELGDKFILCRGDRGHSGLSDAARKAIGLKQAENPAHEAASVQ